MRRHPLITIFVFVSILMAMGSAATAQTTDEGAETYSKKCSRCHKDDGLGVTNKYPPLAGNLNAADLDYVIEVVTDGLSGKEIMGVVYTREMRSFSESLTPEQIRLVSEYVVELSVSGPLQTPSTTAPTGEGTVSNGDNLFRGTTLLSGGGTACIACHSAGEYDSLGGPSLAFNLNGVIDDFGTAGFVDAITSPVADEMISTFQDRPISTQEANDIAAYLETTSAETTDDSSPDLLLLLGLLGFLLLVLITALLVQGPQQIYTTKLRSTR